MDVEPDFFFFFIFNNNVSQELNMCTLDIDSVCCLFFGFSYRRIRRRVEHLRNFSGRLLLSLFYLAHVHELASVYVTARPLRANGITWASLPYYGGTWYTNNVGKLKTVVDFRLF